MRTTTPAGRVALLLLVLSLAGAAAKSDDETAAQDRITHVPGFDGELPSAHYAGYVRVGGGGDGDGEGGEGPPARHLFYYLVESERDPARDPVVLWLNGGPGCSSFDAFVYEHGPFLFSPPSSISSNSSSSSISSSSSSSSSSSGAAPSSSADRLPTLSLNPFSWSKVATIIYLDSPGNVGLSYVGPDPSSRSPYRTNDTHTAADADAFLRELLGERHPRLRSRDFFVTGESYAGIYVPMLAREIVRGNRAGAEPQINLRGYAVGNGCTDAEYDGNALPPFLAGRGLLPTDEYGELYEACGGSFWDAEFSEEEHEEDVKGALGEAGGAAAENELRAGASRGQGRGGSGSSGSSGSGGSRAECGRLLGRAGRVLDGINIYDVLDLCHASHRPHAGESDGGASLGLAGPWAAATAGLSSSSVFSFSPDARVAALRPSARVPPSSALSSPPSSRRPTPRLGHNPPCTSATLAEDWLNDERVRRALHAPPPPSPDDEQDGGGGGFSWTLCSDRVRYTHDAGSMLPVHAELLPGLPGWPLMLARAGLAEEAGRAAAAANRNANNGAAGGGLRQSSSAPPRLRALVYTGDHDAAVPSTGSEAWTRDMGGGRALPGRGWRRWQVAGGTDAGGRPAAGDGEDKPRQVAGFTADYAGGLTYATVRGAGHMVPTSKPLEALELFRRFVDGEELAPAEEEERGAAVVAASF